MRAVIQRVARASVTIDGQVSGAIERGLLVYLGVGRGDGERERGGEERDAGLLRHEQASSLEGVLGAPCRSCAEPR
jgi:hypothetical protein